MCWSRRDEHRGTYSSETPPKKAALMPTNPDAVSLDYDTVQRMTLSSGTKLGPYEIVGPLGAGGMGEVYRARDTRLDRDVALKILPANISADPVAKQRFEREAKTISGLNHPNICVLH